MSIIDLERGVVRSTCHTRMTTCMACSTPTASFCKACFAAIRRGANGHGTAEITQVRRVILQNPDEAIRRMFVRFDLGWPKPWLEKGLVHVLLGPKEQTPVQIRPGRVPALIAKLANIRVGNGRGTRRNAITHALREAGESP